MIEDSPEAREARKTAQQRAEDVAYVLDHSAACIFSDFVTNPFINAATDGAIKGIGGCGHDHSQDHAHGPGHHHHEHHGHHHEHGAHCAHDRHAPAGRWENIKLAMRQSFSRQRIADWFKGEFIGDVGAVPLTIAVQMWAPGVMEGIRRAAEPVAGPVFHAGIAQDSAGWARARGVLPGSPEYKEHVKEVYEHEMQHLPQAVVWTGFSLAGNVGYQMLGSHAADKSLWRTVAACLSGQAVTAGLVMGARSYAPHRTRALDEWTSRQFLVPVVQAAGKVAGVSKEDLQKAAEKRESWAQRMDGQKSVAAVR